MRRQIAVAALVVAFVALFGLPLAWIDGPGEPEATLDRTPATVDAAAHAQPEAAERLHRLYADWREKTADAAGHLNLALGWNKGLSDEHTDARGTARFDLNQGTFEVAVTGLEDGAWDIWVVDNQPGEGMSVAPEDGDVFRNLGRLAVTGGEAALETTLVPSSELAVDLVVVTRAGVEPADGGTLFGMPTLFQRMDLAAWTTPATELGPALQGRVLDPFGPSTAFAVDTPFNSMDPLVAQGADLFFNETFDGNGRTCATCHPAENNFTVDPAFIATLPADDPLFLAETDPNLAFLENTLLLRELGLVSVNADGFNRPTVERGVQHLLGLSRYLQPGNQAVPPLQRTGWAGDGAPGSGTIREFAIGAIRQHMTASIDRVAGADFRLPTDAELDAFEAFLLVLGREDNPDISAISLKGAVPEAGRLLFQSSKSQCGFCHLEAGANGPVPGLNFNFDIGIGELETHPAEIIDPGSLNPDGGFGTTPLFDPVTGDSLGFGNIDPVDGNERRFNSQPVIESVDTPPFFHNSAVRTLEQSIAFYNGEEFLNSPAGALNIQLEATEVEAIAAFLRVMNVLENLRSSNERAEAAQLEPDTATSQRLAELAAFDTQDAYQVLEEGGLNRAEAAKLRKAFFFETQAAQVPAAAGRFNLLQQALNLKDEVEDALVH